MVRNEIKSAETNIVLRNHLLITKNKARKKGVILLKMARKDRAGGRKMEKERGEERENKKGLNNLDL